MTLESKWPFSNVFNSSTSTMASTCPYLIETTSDRICFFVRSHPEPQGRFFSLRIDTRGNKHNHVFLFRFLLFSDWTGSKLLTKYYIVHLKLHDTFWLKTNFLDVEVVNHWCEIATKENVTFVMIFKYNIDHEFICHEPGHVKSVSCHLAKKRFKKYPPKRRTNLNHNVLPNIVENFGTFPGMQTVREEREDQSKVLIKLPPFDTLFKKHNIELMGNTMGWLIPAPASVNLQPSLVSDPRLMKLNGQELLPIMSELARQLNGSLRNQEFPLILERQELSRCIHRYRERAQKKSEETNEASPSCSYHISMEELPVSTAASSQLQGAINDVAQIYEHRERPQKKSHKIKEALPSCSYQISVEKLSVQTSICSQLPGIPYDRPKISEHREQPQNYSQRIKEHCSYHIKVEDLSACTSASFQLPGVSYRQKVSQLREQGQAIKKALRREIDLPVGSSVSSQLPGIPYNRQQSSQIREQAHRKAQGLKACSYQRREEGLTKCISTTSRLPGVPYARVETSKLYELRLRAQRGSQEISEAWPSSHRRVGGLPEYPSTARLPGVPYARQETSGPHELRERSQKEPQEMMEVSPSCGYQEIVEDLSVRSSVSSRLPEVPYNRQEASVRAQSKSQDMEEAIQSSSYRNGAEDLSVQTNTSNTSASYQSPGVPHAMQETSAQRFPERTASSCWSVPDKGSADVTGRSGSILPNISEVPAKPTAVFKVPIPEPSPSQISRIYRVRNPAYRRRGRRRIIITCGGERFHVNSKILEDASPVMRAFMNYWTPVPDSNGDIFLEIDGVTTIALENLIKYLSNDSFNHGVMRSSHMKELTRKLKIDINLV